KSTKKPMTGKYEWNDEANTIVFKKYAVMEKPAKVRATVQSERKKYQRSVKRQGRITVSDVKSRLVICLITLKKAVALQRLKKSGMQLRFSSRFTLLYKSNELDQLILAFAQYFDTHFKILDFTERFAKSQMLPNSLQILEQEGYKRRIQKCLEDLAQVYAHFIMQERRKYLEVKHATDRSVNPEHQARQDRCLFDTIYWFLVFVTWVIFNRKRFKIICAEIGWFTRSEIFNSIGRLGSVQCGRDSSHGDSLTSSYMKNLHRTNMLNQRSPACRLLLPKPSEKMGYLDRSHETISCRNGEKVLANRDGFGEPDYSKVNIKFGILGDELSSYDEQLIANSVDGNQLANIEEQTRITSQRS
ncbi:protein phosphatase 1 regulatory subunit 36, partial [Paragonimus westermani]